MSIADTWNNQEITQEQYTDCLKSISAAGEKDAFIVSGNTVKVATLGQWLFNKIKGLLGFEDRTNIVRVNYEIFKLLSYGEKHHYNDALTVQPLIEQVNSTLSSRQVDDAISKIFTSCKAHNYQEIETEINSYCNQHKQELGPSFWSRLIEKKEKQEVTLKPDSLTDNNSRVASIATVVVQQPASLSIEKKETQEVTPKPDSLTDNNSRVASIATVVVQQPASLSIEKKETQEVTPKPDSLTDNNSQITSVATVGVQQPASLSDDEETEDAVAEVTPPLLADVAKKPVVAVNPKDFLASLDREMTKWPTDESVMPIDICYELITQEPLPEKKDASILERWLMKSLRMAQGFSKETLETAKQRFDSLEKDIGFNNAFLVCARAYQLSLFLSDKGSEEEMFESQLAKSYFIKKLVTMIHENPEKASSIKIDDLTFEDKEIPAQFLETIELQARVKKIQKDELEAKNWRFKVITGIALAALVGIPALIFASQYFSGPSLAPSTQLAVQESTPRYTLEIPPVAPSQIFTTVNNELAERKVSLVTAYDEGIREYASYVIPNQRDYAAKHHYNYVEYKGNLAHDDGVARAPYWSKIVALKDMLDKTQEGEWLVWLDASAIFTNTNKDFDEIIDNIIGLYGAGKELIVTTDPHVPINNAVFIVKNSPWTKQWIEKVWSRKDLAKGGDGSCWSWGLPICHYEQQAMTELWQRDPDVEAHTAVIPNKIMNAFYRYSHYDKYRDMELQYDTDAEESKWQAGDFICKVTGMDKDRRLMIIQHVSKNCIDKACERKIFHPDET